MIYPICSVVAIFKMLVRILNTLPSRIWDISFFLFSGYLNLQLERMGIFQKVMDFLWKLNPKGLTHFFWRNPLFFPHKILISSGPINRNPKTLYRIKCDVGASKNAGQAFSTPRLSSHFILYNVSGFRFFNPSNQNFC